MKRFNKPYSEWHYGLYKWWKRTKEANCLYHAWVYRNIYSAAIRNIDYQRLDEYYKYGNARPMEYAAAVTPFGSRILEEVGITFTDLEKIEINELLEEWENANNE
nr:MAG TPA: hypothetical protein [Caudoviricetes sp.]